MPKLLLLPTEIVELAVEHIYQEREETARELYREAMEVMNPGGLVVMRPVPMERAAKLLEETEMGIQEMPNPPSLDKIMDSLQLETLPKEDRPEAAYRAMRKALKIP